MLSPITSEESSSRAISLFGGPRAVRAAIPMPPRKPPAAMTAAPVRSGQPRRPGSSGHGIVELSRVGACQRDAAARRSTNSQSQSMARNT